MPKYLLLSFPLLAALLVGLIVYGVTLSSLNPPTEAEIKAAPSWEEAVKRVTEEYRSTPRPIFDAKALEEALRRMKEDGPVEPAPDTPRPPRQPSTKRKPGVILSTEGNWREKLRPERQGAVLKAKRTAGICGIVTAMLGYIALGVYFHRLGHAQPKQSWRDVVSSRNPDAAENATTSSESTYDAPAPEEAPAEHTSAEETPAGEALDEEPPPEEAPAEEPLPEEALAQAPPELLSTDEGPYEPYGPPIDISEIETAYEQERKDRPPRQT